MIAVIPRHSFYYRRVLMFEPLGSPRRYECYKGLTTAPLRLDSRTAEERYREKFGRLSDARNLHDFFIDEREGRILSWLRRERRPMSAEDFQHFFVDQTNIVANARPRERSVLQRLYPTCNIESRDVWGACA